MPRFHGTGPRGQGPMTGRGEGYCAMVLPESGQAPYGYAGLQSTPVRLGTPAARPVLGTRFARWPRPAMQRAPYPPPMRPHYGGYARPFGLGRPRWGMGRGFWGRGWRGLGRGWGRGRW